MSNDRLQEILRSRVSKGKVTQPRSLSINLSRPKDQREDPNKRYEGQEWIRNRGVIPELKLQYIRKVKYYKDYKSYRSTADKIQDTISKVSKVVNEYLGFIPEVKDFIHGPLAKVQNLITKVTKFKVDRNELIKKTVKNTLKYGWNRYGSDIKSFIGKRLKLNKLRSQSKLVDEAALSMLSPYDRYQAIMEARTSDQVMHNESKTEVVDTKLRKTNYWLSDESNIKEKIKRPVEGKKPGFISALSVLGDDKYHIQRKKYTTKIDNQKLERLGNSPKLSETPGNSNSDILRLRHLDESKKLVRDSKGRVTKVKVSKKIDNKIEIGDYITTYDRVRFLALSSDAYWAVKVEPFSGTVERSDGTSENIVSMLPPLPYFLSNGYWPITDISYTKRGLTAKDFAIDTLFEFNIPVGGTRATDLKLTVVDNERRDLYNWIDSYIKKVYKPHPNAIIPYKNISFKISTWKLNNQWELMDEKYLIAVLKDPTSIFVGTSDHAALEYELNFSIVGEFRGGARSNINDDDL